MILPSAPPDSSSASNELMGWAYVTNQLLLDNARRVVTEVEEPSRRADLAAEWAAGLAELLHVRSTCVSSMLCRLVTGNSREGTEYGVGETMGLCAENDHREAAELNRLEAARRELHQLRAEREAEEQCLRRMRQCVKQASNTFEEQFGVQVFAPNMEDDTSVKVAELQDSLAAYVEATQKKQVQLQEEVAALRVLLKSCEQEGGQRHALRVGGTPLSFPSRSNGTQYSGVFVGETPYGLAHTAMGGSRPQQQLLQRNADGAAFSPFQGDLSTSGLANAVRAWKERQQRLKEELRNLQ
ncbi:hypothetical protein, conserved [Trypanosoma brucei gambiense DAL972]|uniref:Uncharacterized protein n=1 Tax=Trypanosoma brucei gambiense (strain MHOM/CI/86/DAL972) TaxID=679716 RepID=C9ZY05_TRYB9|nr:hypothetical protein, conserved [Trypanosoma brucei gambiense DAL972]CBH14300.1 hypothetical protein, conserved [Trypanosoma brucei gambiense DAL972]|eukprot:XP_011776570.1 hypothetical protein, conserved [Trypanosoma brucei gambiense DAL972]